MILLYIAPQLFNCNAQSDAEIEKFVRRTNTNPQDSAQAICNYCRSSSIAKVIWINRLFCQLIHLQKLTSNFNCKTRQLRKFSIREDLQQNLKNFQTPPPHETATAQDWPVLCSILKATSPARLTWFATSPMIFC